MIMYYTSTFVIIILSEWINYIYESVMWLAHSLHDM